MAPGDIAFKSNFATLDPQSGIVVRRRADRRCAGLADSLAMLVAPTVDAQTACWLLGATHPLCWMLLGMVHLLLAGLPAHEAVHGVLSICPKMFIACRFEDLGPVLCAALDGLRLPSFPQVGSCSLRSKMAVWGPGVQGRWLAAAQIACPLARCTSECQGVQLLSHHAAMHLSWTRCSTP